ncbi:hypothetical protein FGADI_9083 [Fusarium gaditjirri]|uniref:Apple domain-containing protein n=1 Tax=Fusarium gaditjirri TaxID=282569 RepID=A0A8H4T0X3_9HYPO|nr:hypothetical protein FGADI_9083 [Fusarium gaditjirri]
MDLHQKPWVLSSLVLILYSQVVAAVGSPTCSQLGGAYTGSTNTYNVQCDTITVGQNFLAAYQAQDTLTSCIDRCDNNDDCVAIVYDASSGDCGLVSSYTSTIPYTGYDFAAKAPPAATTLGRFDLINYNINTIYRLIGGYIRDYIGCYARVNITVNGLYVCITAHVTDYITNHVRVILFTVYYSRRHYPPRVQDQKETLNQHHSPASNRNTLRSPSQPSTSNALITETRVMPTPQLGTLASPSQSSGPHQGHGQTQPQYTAHV